MTSFTTFYLSRILGKKVFNADAKPIGTIKDLLIDSDPSNHSLDRPMVLGAKLKTGKSFQIYSFQFFQIKKIKGRIKVICHQPEQLEPVKINNSLFLAGSILDKQIVDINGHKVVRVNDIRMARISEGTFALAVDIGVDGLLRRIGIEGFFDMLFSFFNVDIPNEFILWEDLAAIDSANSNIKLSNSYRKLQNLHPSDLADIIEDLGKRSSTDIFMKLDEEKAADVLEELETKTQIHILESISIEKAADVLEKMPADEAAEILDYLDSDKVELLLNEMEKDSSSEVRELLDYKENTVGSIMSTDYLSFDENKTVEEILNELRNKKPEFEMLYNFFVTDQKNVLLATFTLRDLVISSPETRINQIMKPSPVHLYDHQNIDVIAGTISKYDLLAIPVVNSNHELEGMVVIDDVIDDLINKRRTN